MEPNLPLSGRRGGRWNDHRTVLNGILFRIRTGVPWRDLPERYGSWKTVYERHRRWSANGTWGRIRVPRPLGGRPRTRPGHISGDKAYSSRRNRRYLRRRDIKHTIPEPEDQRASRRREGKAGGRPAGFDPDRYKRRNEVDRTVNRLKNSRAVATRYDKRAYVFHGTVTAAAVRLWLKP